MNRLMTLQRHAIATCSKSRRLLPLCFYGAATLAALLAAIVPAAKPIRRELILIRDVSASITRSSGSGLPPVATDLAKEADTVYTILVSGRAWLAHTGHGLPPANAGILPGQGTLAGMPATDLQAALIRMTAIPRKGATRRRVLLISDGLETSNNAAEFVHSISNKILVETAMIGTVPAPDARALCLEAPSAVMAGTGFPLVLHVNSAAPVSATIKLRDEDGGQIAAVRACITPAGVRIPLRAVVTHPGLHILEAEVQVKADVIPENNLVRTAVMVRGKDRILWLGRKPPSWLAKSFNLIHGKPHHVRPAMQTRFTCVVMDNVPRDALAPGSSRILQESISRGMGLVVLGGPQSLGPGDYNRALIGDIPLGNLLPTRLEPVGSLGLAVLLDISGSMDEPAAATTGRVSKLSLAVTAIIKTWSRLVAGDQAGLAVFADKTRIMLKVSRIDEESSETVMTRLRKCLLALRPGGSTKLLGAMVQACRLLEEVRARQLHLIVVTDGDTEETAPQIRDALKELSQQTRERNIGISVITVGARPDLEVMRKLKKQMHAEITTAAGRVVLLPMILDEKLRKARAYMEHRIKASVIHAHPVMHGLTPEDLPVMRTLVAVGPEKKKQGAVTLVAAPDNSPLAAAWNLGLGRVILLTGAPWHEWGWKGRPAGRKLFRQALAWCANPPGRDKVLRAGVREGSLVLELSMTGTANPDTVSSRPAGVFAARLTRITFGGDPLKPMPEIVIRLYPQAPGFWRGMGSPPPAGIYRVDVLQENTVVACAPFIRDNRREWLRFGADGTALARIAMAGNGDVVTAAQQLTPWQKVPVHGGRPAASVSPVLLAAAAILFLLGLAASAWR